MRAFMSRIHSSSASDGWIRADAAEREARAILAVNEPIPDGFRIANQMLRAELAWANDESRAALADALRAFVGEE